MNCVFCGLWVMMQLVASLAQEGTLRVFVSPEDEKSLVSKL